MTWPFNTRSLSLWNASDYVNDSRQMRTSSASKRVSKDDALRHSAVWACLRLRNDLVSMMPIDVFRKVNVGGKTVQVELPKPPVLVTTGGERVRVKEWMYSTGWDLDESGNTFGIITERDKANKVARVDLQPTESVVVRMRKGVLTYQIDGTVYQPNEIWHEKQFTQSGMPVGLSPIAHAAMSINGYLSAQAFAAEWFSNSAVPAGSLKNTEKVIKSTEAQAIKERFKASISAGDLFVHGKDWDYSMLAAKASETQFIEERHFGLTDACRYFGVPGDMVDAAPTGGRPTLVYANITQRNLQLLITNLQPAIDRREEAISWGMLPDQWYAKLNTAALLRMDLKSRYESYGVGIDKRFIAPSEARDYENLPPFTPEQIAEFEALKPASTPVPSTGEPA